MVARTSKTLIYSPSIKVIVATDNGVFDLSDDVVNFQVRRVLNGASSFSCVLNNRRQKYTGQLKRMDRVFVYLTRVKELQVFTGYLDSVPGLSFYTNTCEIRATCTLKRLLFTYWDPGLASSQAVLDQNNNLPLTGTDAKNQNEAKARDPQKNDKTDSGIGTMLGNVLHEVAAWNRDEIHIQDIPEGFMKLALAVDEKQTSALDGNIELWKKLLGITGGSGGTSTTPSGGTATIAKIGDYQEHFTNENDFESDFIGPYPPGDDPIERWRPLAMLALQQMSMDPAIIDVMMHRLGQESTGDPNAINLTDGNAQKGTPSQGIFQCIAPTFHAYAVAPYNKHLKSPLGSMLAAINWVKTGTDWVKKPGETDLQQFTRAWEGTHGF